MNMRRKKVTSGDVSPRGDTQEPAPELGGDSTDTRSGPPPTLSVETPPANRPRYPAPWGNVITDVFRLDVQQTFERLNADLTLGDGASEYGSVLRALDQAARNALDAARLVRAAKLADEKFAAELNVQLEVMRTTAREQLEQEKADGKRSKAPTIQEVDDRMIANWPDAVHHLRERLAEMHGAFRAIEALEKAWWSRCVDLRTMADRFNSGRG